MKLISRIATILTCIAVLQLFQQVRCFTFASIKVEPDIKTINTVTRYKFTFDRTQDDTFAPTAYSTIAILPSDTATITFPTGYVLSTVSCSVSVNGGTPFTPTSCQVSGSKVVASGIVTSNTYIASLILWINNIVNPSPAYTTDYFYGTIGSDTSGIGSYVSTVILQPGTFASCYITFTPNTVNSTADMILTMVPTNAIGPAGSVTVQFPTSRRWSNDISSTNHMPISSSMVCSNKSGNVKSTFQCTGSTTDALVTAANLFDSSVSTSFSFSINSFLSPPTQQPSDPINITSWINGSKIDVCSTYVSNLSPKTITALSLASSTGAPIIVNRPYLLRFSIVLPDTVSQTDTIIVNLPVSTSFSLVISNISSNFSVNPNATTYDADNRNLYLYMSNQGRTFAAGTLLVLTIGTYTAPVSAQPTGDFTITFYRNLYRKIAGTASLTASASTLTASVNITSAVVNAVTSYTFTITTSDALSSAGRIKIILPSTISIGAVPSTCATVSTTGLATPTCTVNTVQNSITLANLNVSSAIIPAMTMTIIIAGIKNPPSTAPTLPITINTYYRSTDVSLVATGTIPSVTASIATIDSSKISVMPSSYVVNDQSVTYYLNLTIANPIPAGGNFTIYLPPDVSFTLASVPGHCSININNTSYTPTSCVADTKSPGYLINFTNPFPVDMTVGSNFVARVASIITNPSSTRPTASFGLYTYSSNGYSIASIDNSMSVSMTMPDSFQTISITRSSNKNYEPNTYTFNIRQKSQLQPSSILLIGFPINVVPSATPSCAITSPTSSSLSCSYSSPTLKVFLPASTIASNANFIVTVGNVRNPASFMPTGTFTFQTRTIGQLYNYSYGLFNPLLNNSIATAFQSISYSFSPAIYGAPTSLTLTFDPSQSGTIPSSLRLSLATSFIVGSISCSTFIDFTGTCNSITSNTIQVTGSFTSAPMTFTVTGITAPNAVPNDYSQLVTFDTTGYKLDQSTTNILFGIICTMPCRTCEPATPTVCLSCYSDTTITPYIYEDTTLKKCYVQCVDGKFENTTTLKCDPCDSKCLTCETSSTFCINCNTTSTLKYLLINTTLATQTCVSACPSTMYPQTSINPTTCKPCNAPCKQCTTATICTSCISGTFYYQNQCLADCPLGIAIKNSGTNNCDFCDSNCLTCVNATTTCTSCNETLLLYLSQCRTSCPAPLVPQNGTCGPCDNTCKTCTGNKYNCTSCQLASTLPYLLNNLCLSQCPQTYYENTAASICSLCSSVAGLNCINCSTSSSCLSCNTGYVLHQQKCLNYTPDGYVNISGVAVACSGDCATCAISPTNCTSCKLYNLYNNQCLVNCLAGFVAISKQCQPCLSPCRTCQTTIDTCTTCLTTLTPSVFLSNSQCVETCPNGAYPTRTNYSCLACKTPCEYCQSLTVCDTCLTGYFLEGTSCVTTCQTGYTGVDRACSPCLGNCATCQNQTNICTSCKPDTYFLAVSSSCVTSCGTGLYIQYLTRTCVACSEPCKTCTNTSDTCLSCTAGVLFNNQCLNQCPQKYFQQSGQCRQCPANCSSCTSLVNCTGCAQNYVLYNGFCIVSCPATDAVIINSVCTKCSTQNCHKCTSADFCTQCASKYSLYNGACLATCPAAFQSNGTHCIDTNKQVLTSSSSFPVPFSIASVVVIIACLMSKLQFGHTFLPGAVYSFLGVIEWGALIYFLYLYFIGYFITQPLPFLVGVAAIAYLMLLNILALFIQNLTLCNDKHFKSWHNDKAHKITSVVVNIVSTVCCHKFRNILFCKLFTFGIFTAPLESTSKFKVLYIFSFLSLLHTGAAIFAAAAATRSAQANTQLYYACIDVIVVTAVNGILAFFNIMKPKDYFYQRTPDGFQLKKRITGDDDGFQSKIQPAGKANEDEQGFVTNVYRVQAGTGFTTNQPFNRQYSNEKDYSYGSLIEKSNQEVSVQAVEQILDKQGQEADEGINSDFSIVFPKNTSKSGFLYNADSKMSQPEVSVQASPILPKNSQSTAQQRVYNKSERQLSPDRTVFFKQQPNYYNPTGSQTKISSPQKNKKVSKISQRKIFDSSGGQQSKQQGRRSSNILYKPDLQSKFSKKSQPVLYVQPESQISPNISDKTKSVSVGDNRSMLKSQLKYKKDEGVQRYQIDSQKAKFQQSQQEIKQQLHPNVIFEEQQHDLASARKENNQNQQLPKGLKQYTKDQLLLPNQEIEEYEKQLQSKIQSKDQQINLMRKKIQSKQKQFNQFTSSQSQIVEAGKIYKKGVMKKSEARNQDQQVGQSPKKNERIKEQIVVTNQKGEARKIKVEINDDKSKQTEQDFINMIEDHQNQLIYEEQDKQDLIPENINQIQVNESRTTMLVPQKQQIQFKQSQGDGYTSSGKDRSTKIQSSAFNPRHNGAQTDNTLINVHEIDKSADQGSERINEKPLGPDVLNIRTDLSDTYEPVSKEGLNKTLGNLKNKKQTRQPGEYSQRIQRQDFQQQKKKQGRYDKSPDAQKKESQPAQVLPRKAQSINKPNPMKTINRFEFQNYEKNISESGQDELPFRRVRPNLVAPFQTDKQQTQFKSSQIESPRRIMVPRQTSTIPASRSISRSISNTSGTPNYARPYQRQSPNKNPLIMQMEQGQGSVRPRQQLQFGPADRDDEPYIEEDDEDYSSKYKNTIVLHKMQDRPDNDDIRKYYEEHQARKAKSREKSKKKPSQVQLQTQKIYLQQQTPSSGKKWK